MHRPRTLADFMPGQPFKEPPLPKFLLNPARAEKIRVMFKVGDKVRVLDEPVLVGSLVAGRAGKIISMGTHPYGEKYGVVYLVQLEKGGDFWFGRSHLEKIK